MCSTAYLLSLTLPCVHCLRTSISTIPCLPICVNILVHKRLPPSFLMEKAYLGGRRKRNRQAVGDRGHIGSRRDGKGARTTWIIEGGVKSSCSVHRFDFLSLRHSLEAK
ncbi:hypothetical protein BDN72DRAFT_39583 [Pluteus cervinus]|uniref:Uncharacterized protein n=1 Tax=Pluteus cervinus TaxID=181527 RepID=A0ACD3BHM3_9AGAR|nr:hypothetical protein BDN72DRAFT_39583 [Pluteus cervinus]